MVSYNDTEVRFKVTYRRVASKIPREKRLLLDEPVVAGGGLTDQTYGDWIVGRGRRIFLILDNLGCPDCIFDFVKMFLEDSDLLLHPRDISNIGFENISYRRKFYRRQFDYLPENSCRDSGVAIKDAKAAAINVLPPSGISIAADDVRKRRWKLSRWRKHLHNRKQHSINESESRGGTLPASIQRSSPVAFHDTNQSSDERGFPVQDLLSPLWRCPVQPPLSLTRNVDHRVLPTKALPSSTPMPQSRFNIILGLAASRPATPPGNFGARDTSCQAKARSMMPETRVQDLGASILLPFSDSTTTMKDRPSLQSQLLPQPTGLPNLTDAALPCSYSDDSINEDTWLPPTPTSTLFHPTIYTLAAEARDEDPRQEPSTIHTFDPYSVCCTESDVALSPTAVFEPRSSTGATEEIFLPEKFTSAKALRYVQNGSLPVHGHTASGCVDNESTSSFFTDNQTITHLDSEGDDKSVIIALDAYVLPRPLLVSYRSRSAEESLNRSSLQSRRRASGLLDLRSSCSWSALANSSEAKAAMGAGEDEGRARFRSRWEQRLARNGTVTAKTSNMAFVVGDVSDGPNTGPAVLAKHDAEAPCSKPTATQWSQSKSDALKCKGRTERQNETWWGNEWSQWCCNSAALQRTCTVKRESTWIQERRARERGNTTRSKSA